MSLICLAEARASDNTVLRNTARSHGGTSGLEKPVRSLHETANQRVLARWLPKPHVTGGDCCQVHFNRGEGFMFVNQILQE